MSILLFILGLVGVITLGFLYFYVIYYVIFKVIYSFIRFSCWCIKRGILHKQRTDEMIKTYVKDDEVHLVFKKRKPVTPPLYV